MGKRTGLVELVECWAASVALVVRVRGGGRGEPAVLNGILLVSDTYMQ